MEHLKIMIISKTNDYIQNQVECISRMQGWFNREKSIYVIYTTLIRKNHHHLSWCRKASDKNPTPFMIKKTLDKLEGEESSLTPVKGTDVESTDRTTFKGKRRKASPCRSGARWRLPSPLLAPCVGGSDEGKVTRKRKRVRIAKEDGMPPILAWRGLAYTKPPGIYTHTLGRRDQSARLQDTRSWHENRLYVICTSNEQPKNWVKKTTPLTTVSERIHYLGTNLTEKLYDVYSENYKNITERNWRPEINGTTSCVQCWKVATPQTGPQIQHNPHQNPSCLLCRNWQADAKIEMERQWTPNNQSHADSDKRSWRALFPEVKLTTSCSTGDRVAGHKDDRPMDGPDSPEIDAHSLVSWRRAWVPRPSMGEKYSLNKWTTARSHAKRRHSPVSHHTQKLTQSGSKTQI